MRPRAFVDESFEESPDKGVYVLAAVVVTEDTEQRIRDLMSELRGSRRIPKSHWHQMEAGQRKDAAARLADIGGLHLVVTGVPVPPRAQERARTACLRVLAAELHGFGVEHLTVESRTRTLDGRDIRTVSGVRYGLPRGTHLHIDHRTGPQEPLLWAADIVAGAVRAAHEGIVVYRDLLAECLYEIAIDIAL